MTTRTYKFLNAFEGEFTTRDGSKEYEGFQITYNNGDKQENKIIHHKSIHYKTLVEGFSKLKPKDEFTVEIEEKGEFKNWVSVTKGGAPEGSDKTSGNKNPYSGKSGGSTYQTAEERKETQGNIIRQHAVTKAIEILTANKENITLDKVFELADTISHYSKTGERSSKKAPTETKKATKKKEFSAIAEEDEEEASWEGDE